MITDELAAPITKDDLEYLIREAVTDDGEMLALLISAFRVVAVGMQPSPKRLDDMFAVLETTARKRWAARGVSASPALLATQDYLRRGWYSVPVPAGRKGPVIVDWETLRLGEADLPAYFSNGSNNGLILGDPSGGLTDIDLDKPETRRIADRVLPPTQRISGREKNPYSHFWYICGGETKVHRFQDPIDKGTLVEFRGTGGQTLVHPSRHDKDGDLYVWHEEGDPATVAADDLLDKVRLVAAIGLLARRWPGIGGRHDAALALSGMLHGAGWSLSDAETFVELVAIGAQDQEVSDRVRGVRDTYGRAKAGKQTTGIPTLADLTDPRVVTKVREWLGMSGFAAGAPEPDSPRPKGYAYRLTDVGNGHRFVDQHHEQVRFCHDWKSWFTWDGKRWDRDATGFVEMLAKQTVRGIYADAAAAENEDMRKRLGAWASKSESRDRIAGMLWAARTEDGLPVRIEQMDTDPWALNVANGTLDLRTGSLRPHRREDLITKLVPVAYDPAARAPRWTQFLEEVTDNNPDLEGFLRRAVGYSLTGITREHCLFILWGLGRNGKSVFLAILRALAADYARVIPSDALMVKRSSEGDPASPNIAKLKGARVVTSTETEDGRRMAESLIKEITGGDTITARHLYAESFDFTPEFTVWIAGNNKPVIRGTDPAIWARIRLVPFLVSFLGREDRNLINTLMGELPGILSWAVAGCLEWQSDGLTPPACIQSATDQYRGEMDLLGQFLADRCSADDPNAWTSSQRLYDAFSAWCREQKERAISKKKFGLRLKEMGFAEHRTDRARGWDGLALGNDANDTSGAECGK